MEILERRVVTLAEALELLSNLRDDQADQIQRRTLDYLSKFAKLGAEEARRLRRRLVEEGGLSEEEAVEVINVYPKSIQELRAFTAGWKRLLPTEQLEEILKILREEGKGEALVGEGAEGRGGEE